MRGLLAVTLAEMIKSPLCVAHNILLITSFTVASGKWPEQKLSDGSCVSFGANPWYDTGTFSLQDRMTLFQIVSWLSVVDLAKASLVSLTGDQRKEHTVQPHISSCQPTSNRMLNPTRVCSTVRV